MKLIAVVVQMPCGEYKLVGDFGPMHGSPAELADVIAGMPVPEVIDGEVIPDA